jgi:hypothetical protein
MSETVTDPGVEQAEAPDEPTEAPEEPTEAPEPEPEVDDDPDQDEGVEAQAPQGPSPEEIEKILNKLEKSANTWRNRIAELLGEEAKNLTECELCGPQIPGFHWPAKDIEARNPVHARLLDVLRQPDAPDYSPAQHVRRCQLCDGWGVVLSGSRVAGKGQVKCQMCKGNGFVGDAILPTEAPSPNGEVEVEFPDDTGPLVVADADAWGSPRLLDDGQENPNYGRMPQYKDKSLP